MAYDFNSLTKQANEAINRDKFYTDFEDVDPNVLHQISDLTEWIRTKGKGSDVREVIAQLFERTWIEGTKEGNANFEVAKARGVFKTLAGRLNNFDAEIQNVAGGSPKGVYANLSALQAAKPNGDSGIYVTTDNGHWYYYSDGWKDGGVYQASASLNQTTDKVLYSHLDLTKLKSWNGLSFKVDENSIIETKNSNERCGLIVDVPATAKYLNMKFIEKNATEVQLYKYDPKASNGVGTILETIKVSAGSIYTYSLTEYGTYMFVFKGNGLTNKLKIAASDTKSVDLTDVIEAFDDSLDVSKLSDKAAFGDEVNLGTITTFGAANLVKKADTITAKVYANNGGLYTSTFTAHSNRVVVYTDLTFTQKGITIQVSYIDKTDNQRKYKTLNKFTGGKADKVEFDASNLVIYSNADPTTFKLLMQANTDSTVGNDPVGDITLGRLSIFDAGGSGDVSSNPMYEPALKSTLSNIIGKLTEIGADIAELKSRKGSYVTMPDGSEGKLVYVNGVVTVKGSNYNKVLLLGNSLLLGFSTDGSHGAPFGCTASDSKHDWAYLLTEKLKVKSPNVTVKKLHDAKFEQAESDTASEGYISNEFAAADRNNDLVIVQIGDNVNTELRQQTFRNNFSKLIRAIRTNNPAADIVVAGAWFNNAGIENFLQAQASNLNYTFVPLSDLSTSANMATVGDTVTFDDGVQMQVYEAIRTHPGNRGMEAIANRIYDNLN
ncbi:SGNH/GDSL hydrolase family protein [uncultured Streptococcus sp.]|jgi:lysophospholipase L1-like esterase|uniref:SGNH/GDSL hydrolase family protein n=1 Tax=uncultured Streptococcus sp. TaxID=83427 RepID=UPI00206BA239|nr:SGNH/GDSL hydrolase family protein [uncultured Streptococcus sp.]DAM41992.1 MAG TPA: hypothetical protein [Caudoviricetes sp.]